MKWEKAINRKMISAAHYNRLVEEHDALRAELEQTREELNFLNSELARVICDRGDAIREKFELVRELQGELEQVKKACAGKPTGKTVFCKNCKHLVGVTENTTMCLVQVLIPFWMRKEYDKLDHSPWDICDLQVSQEENEEGVKCECYEEKGAGGES